LKQRVGDWIETYNGEKYYPIDPDSSEVYLENIAHGLSMMCRFNGQCKYFFSVAQHSINAQKEIANLTQFWDKEKSIKAQLLGLFHDGSECLGISDICSPAKKYMPEYQAIEEKIQNTVWEHFNLQHTDEEYDIVKLVDSAMAAFEARELMKCKHWDLSYSYLIHCDRDAKTYIDLSFRNMKDVEDEFLEIANGLLEQYKQLL
jgi:5'-deoxynucleotidase YfbR-like HD superfamily hydrolase